MGPFSFLIFLSVLSFSLPCFLLFGFFFFRPAPELLWKGNSNGRVYYFPPGWLCGEDKAKKLGEQIWDEVEFGLLKDIAQMGINVVEPRRVLYLSDSSVEDYSYSFTKRKAGPFTKGIRVLLFLIKVSFLSHNFGRSVEKLNCALLNCYLDGEDSMGFHSDHQAIAEDKIVVSASFGAARKMEFRTKRRLTAREEDNFSILLDEGSLVVMTGHETQSLLEHSIPKQKKVSSPRLNVTFRAHKLRKEERK